MSAGAGEFAMTRREKISVGVMLLVLLYGGFELVSRAGRKPEFSKDGGNSTKALAAVISAGLGDSLSTEAEIAVLENAAVETLKDPFVDKPMPFPGEAAEGAESQDTSGFAYSGFLQAGDALIAFINGREYRVGDELAVGGYVVDKIDSSEVVLRGKAGGGTVTIPIDEGSL